MIVPDQWHGKDRITDEGTHASPLATTEPAPRRRRAPPGRGGPNPGLIFSPSQWARARCTTWHYVLQ